MTDCKFMRLLGLCMAAGKLVSGEQALTIALDRKRARLVVLDAQSSAATQKRITEMTQRASIPLIVIDADVGKMVGHQGRMMAAVTDNGFAKALMQAYNG